MKKTLFVVITSIVLCNLSFSQSQTFQVSPYDTVHLPKEPLVYYPVSAIGFTKDNISIVDLETNSAVSNKEEVEITDAKAFFNRNYNPTKNNFQGYPGSVQASIIFRKPGKRYRVDLRPSASCPECVHPTGSFPDNRVLIGSNSFVIEVGYPTRAIESGFDSVQYFGDKKVRTNIACQQFTNEKLYTHKIFIYESGSKVFESEMLPGSRVDLDAFMQEVEFGGKVIGQQGFVFKVEGYYDGNKIELSKNRFLEDSFIYKALFELVFESVGDWTTDKDNIRTFDFTGRNLAFKIYRKVIGTDKKILPLLDDQGSTIEIAVTDRMDRSPRPIPENTPDFLDYIDDIFVDQTDNNVRIMKLRDFRATSNMIYVIKMTLKDRYLTGTKTIEFYGVKK